MIFRQATPEDARELISLTHTAFLRYAREVGKEVKGISETIDDVLDDIENKLVLLAVEDDKLMGAVRLETIKNIVYISRLCSTKAESNVNVGAMLIEKAKELTKADALCLHTSTKISSLVMFYYRCGFYIASVNEDRGYPRGLFVCNMTDNNNINFNELTKHK